MKDPVESLPCLIPADQLPTQPTEKNPIRRRRKASSVSHGVLAGDMGAPALATSRASMSATDIPSDMTSLLLSKGDMRGIINAKRRSKRRRPLGNMSRLKLAMLKRTYMIPTIILAIFGLLYAINPTEANPIHHFIFLSYRIDNDPGVLAGKPVQYGKGPWDIAFVSFYIVVLSFTREFIMQEILRPLARRTSLRSRTKQARFMEQMYSAIYFIILGPAGLWVMKRTPVWYYNTAGMWENYPHRTHDAYFKFYYLFQGAYWAQQAIVLVLGLEKPRKDFNEMIAHHIVTLSLIGLSYRFHFTYIGIAIYNTHDLSDLCLAVSKVLHYMDSIFVEPFFFFFMVSWAYLRHFLNLKILWSLFTEYKTIGPYTLDWATEQYKCWIANYITIGLLSSLQILNMFWFYMIVKIALCFIRDNTATDDRSDDEDELDTSEVEARSKSEKDAKKQPAEKNPSIIVNEAT